MKKTFNPQDIEQKAFLIQKGMKLNLHGEQVTVMAAGTDFTVLNHENGTKSYPHPMKLVNAYKQGLMTFIVEEKAVLANKQLTDEKDKLKARLIEPMLWSLHERANKHSKETLMSVIKNAKLPEGFSISPSTLRRHYITFVENDMDIFPVIKKPKKTRAKRHLPEMIELAEKAIDIFFLVPSGLSKRQCYFKFLDLVEEECLLKDSPIERDTKVVSESRFYEMINELNEVDVVYARKGKDAARAFARHSQGKYLLDFPLQRVEIDAIHLGIGIRDEDGNYIGTAIVYLAICCFTRCIVGYSISLGTSVAETAEGVLELLKHCVTYKSKTPLAENDWPLTGVPFSLVGDAGKAFNCREVKHFLAQIKCNYITTETKRPWRKGFIESFNRTLRTKFARLLPGYTRNNDEDNSDKSIEEIATLTMGDFINVLECFILDHYHQDSHRGLFGNTPANECEEALKECSPRLIPDLSKIDLVGGFEHEGVIQGCQGVQKNRLYYQSKQLNDLRLQLHKAGDKGNPKVQYIYSTRDISKITVISEVTGELISVPCLDPRVEPGMSLAEFRKLTGQNKIKSGNSKVFTRENFVITEALREDAHQKVLKQLEKKEKEAEKQEMAASRKGKKAATESTKRQSHKNLTDSLVSKADPEPQYDFEIPPSL